MATCIRFEYNNYEFYDMNKNFFFSGILKTWEPGLFFPIENDELWFDGPETTSHGETSISGI